MPKNVLVIEREFDTARQIARALESEGYFVFTASGAEAGLVMARRVKPALIFLNLSLKDTGRTEFISRLRAMEFLRRVPILLITGKDGEYDPRYRDLYGIVNFVRVPLNDAEITAMSKAALEDIPSEASAGRAVESPPEDENIIDEDIIRVSGEAADDAYDAEDSSPADEAAGPAGEQADIAGWQIDMSGGLPDSPGLQPEGEAGMPPGGGDSQEDLTDEAWTVVESTGVESRTAGMAEDAGQDVIEDDIPGGQPPDELPSVPGAPVSEMPISGTPAPETPASEASMPEMLAAGGADEAGYDAGNEAPPATRKAGFETHIEQAMRHEEEKGLFGGKQDLPDKENIFHIPEEEESEAGMKDIKSGQRKKGKKSLALVLAIVLVGAVASYVFFMYLAPKPGRGKEEMQARAGENQSVVIEQNTPSPAAVPAPSAGNAPAASNSGQQAFKTVTPAKNAAAGVKTAAGAGKSAVPVAAAAAVVANPAKNGVRTAAKLGTAKPARVETKKIASSKSRRGEKETAAGSGRERSQGFWALLSKEEKEIGHGRAGKRKSGARHFYSLQVGAFSVKANASRLVTDLKAKRFDAFVEQSEKDGKPIYKVLVGKFSRPGGTKPYYAKLKKDGLKAFHYSQ
ncbi:MAG: SPOR domain-containing protein [Nitrospiraceae bacterium]|nr:SPOR domain-containing protein [Nitrospiraceae bacterium]